MAEIELLGGVREIPPQDWDALVGDESPFLEWAWLASLEESGAVGPETGWAPRPLVVRDGDRLLGAVPLYVKGHSEGEFVFDWGWADAALRAGIDYYPKLLVGVPFTPVTGARLLTAPGVDRPALLRTLAEVLQELCARHRLSGVHVNFCRDDEREALAEAGWLPRLGFQYHWRNRGFADFDDYLASLRSKRRNQARREQRELAAQGVAIAALVGDAIPDALFDAMYDVYLTTVRKNPWGRRYLNRRFFELLRSRFRERLCFVVAHRGDELVAGTLNVQKGDALYGRYWGCHEELRHLHFNVCYYAGIAHCIDAGLARFEPGAGGSYKQLRGFDAVPTWSAHHLRDQRLAAAVDRALDAERSEARQVLDWYAAHSSHRREGGSRPTPACAGEAGEADEPEPAPPPGIPVEHRRPGGGTPSRPRAETPIPPGGAEATARRRGAPRPDPDGRMSALAIGKIIGNCRVTGKIAGGGVGDVYQGVDRALDRPVAIKALRTGLPDQDDVRERFRSEARTLARLDHPNVATVYSLVEEDGELYMVMELVRGQTFAELVGEAGRLRPARAFELFHQALEGLAHAHAAGVVHRDIKSSNLMVSERGVVKVMDFGIARGPGSARLTRFGSVIGTPEFMAPEQIRGEDVTARSDLYSLAIVLFEMLSGTVPFKGVEYDVLRAQVEWVPPALRSLGVEICEALDDALLRALAKRPEERPESLRAFQEELVAAGAPKPATAHTGPFSPHDLVEAVLSGTAGTRPLAASEPTRVLDAAAPDASLDEARAAEATEAQLRPTIQIDRPDLGSSPHWPVWMALVAAGILLAVALALPSAERPPALAADSTRLETAAPENAGPSPAPEEAEAAASAEPEPPDAAAARAEASPRRRASPAQPQATPEEAQGWIIRR